ncbi:hypothetical protein Y695_03575 [Hydrogenophaga sp. T4]|nr:hypothetical protein Y695_03575 [Hydrogenophaga sp. T4]
MEGNQARAVFLPDVAHLAQHVGVVVHAGRRLHTQRVELGGVGELGLAVGVLELGEARNHAAAVAEHPHRAALPVALAGPVGGFELTHQVNHVVLLASQPLEAGHEAGPRTALELVEHRGVVHFLGHVLSPVGVPSSTTAVSLRGHCGGSVGPCSGVGCIVGAGVAFLLSPSLARRDYPDGLCGPTRPGYRLPAPELRQ